MSDPRGPIRKIIAIDDSRTDGTLITMDCGHVGRFNQIFHYTLGADLRCFQCREIEIQRHEKLTARFEEGA